MRINKEMLNTIIIEELRIYMEEEDPLPGVDPELAQAVDKVKKSDPVWNFFSILKALGSGVTDTLKEDLAGEVLEFLEIDPATPMAKIFINFIGNTTLDDLSAILVGSDKCEAITSEIGDALAETIVEEIPTVLGLAPNSRITKVVRESLSKTLTADLSDQIAVALCDIDFSVLVKELPGGKLLNQLFFKD